MTQYVLVEWPEYQYYMDGPRWKECIPVEGPISAYMIPTDIYEEVNKLLEQNLKSSQDSKQAT